MEQMRKLPIGIQTFEKLREENYLYVDKTAMVYKIASNSTPYFLSRPRRFGKSLLISTFKDVKICFTDLPSKNWKPNGRNILYYIWT